jgi:hypothetical protein
MERNNVVLAGQLPHLASMFVGSNIAYRQWLTPIDFHTYFSRLPTYGEITFIISQ